METANLSLKFSHPPPPPLPLPLPHPLPLYQALSANVIERTFGHPAENPGTVVTFGNRMRLKFRSTVALP